MLREGQREMERRSFGSFPKIPRNDGMALGISSNLGSAAHKWISCAAQLRALSVIAIALGILEAIRREEEE